MSWKAAKRSLLGHLIMGWAYPFPALPLLKARKAETLTETLSGLLPDPELSSVLKLLAASGSSCTTWGRSPRPLGLSCSAGAGCWAIYLVRVGLGAFIPAPQFLAPDLPPQSCSVDIYHHEMKLHLTHIYGIWVYFTKLFNIPPIFWLIKREINFINWLRRFTFFRSPQTVKSTSCKGVESEGREPFLLPDQTRMCFYGIRILHQDWTT